MVRDINGLGNVPSTPKTTDQGSRKAPEKSADNTAAPARSGGDGVSLSSEARSLQALGGQISAQPEANLERAERIKLALESGEYKVDDLVVADKLLQTETLFGK